MKDNIYTIKMLCNELNQPRQKIRRRLEKLEIKAINEDTRKHKNDPLEYDHKAFLNLAEEFDLQLSDKKCTASVQHCTTDCTTNEQHHTTDETSKDKLIKVLEEQLEEANKSRSNLEKLLDQQQQLTLVSNKKLESLNLEFEKLSLNRDREEDKDRNQNQEKKTKWYDFFRRKYTD